MHTAKYTQTHTHTYIYIYIYIYYFSLLFISLSSFCHFRLFEQIFLFLSLSLSLYLSISLSFSLSIYIYSSLCISLTLSLYIYVRISRFLSLSLYIYKSLPPHSLFESSQVHRTFLSILADLNNVVVGMISIRPLMFKSSSPFNNPWVTLPRAPITIDINFTFMSQSFFSSLARSRYLSFFSPSYNFSLWSVGTTTLLIPVSFPHQRLLMVFHCLIYSR